ncbi:MAG: flavodoxin family protein [Nitrososphaerota archaeon]
MIKRLAEIEKEQEDLIKELMPGALKDIRDEIIQIGDSIPQITKLSDYPHYDVVEGKLEEFRRQAREMGKTEHEVWVSGTFYKHPGIYDHADTRKLNVLGISTTIIEKIRKKDGSTESFKTLTRSTSEDSLIHALTYAKNKMDCNVRLIKLRDHDFGFCEGYYSSNKEGCQWPCSVSVLDKGTDHLDLVYYGLTEWADIVILSTPIRYNNPSSLYFKLAERLNTVHSHVTLEKKTLIKDKVACFIITGGQDGIQAVAGNLLTFWSEMGFLFPRFSYVGWSRGWYAEHMSMNYFEALTEEEFEADLESMVDTAIELKERLIKTSNEYPKYNKEEYYITKHKSYKGYGPNALYSSGKFLKK